MEKHEVKTVGELKGAFASFEVTEKTEKLFKEKKGLTYKESLLGRLLAAKVAGIKPEELDDFLIKSLDSFKYKGFYWSISHKKTGLAAVISDKPVGIDLEVLEARDEILWTTIKKVEWLVLGEKNWKNFYRIWTAKEAIIKTKLLGLPAVSRLTVVEKQGDNLVLNYRSKKLTARNYYRGNFIWAISQ